LLILAFIKVLELRIKDINVKGRRKMFPTVKFPLNTETGVNLKSKIGEMNQREIREPNKILLKLFSLPETTVNEVKKSEKAIKSITLSIKYS